MQDQLSRKLAVILHADVVGSTLLVQQNETLAHERIQQAFHRMSETIESYGGRTHELRGDALVAEFERASDAICAALGYQDYRAAVNDDSGDDIQPQMRIGISLGEVVIADGTVTGAGVVLAQRLEQLTEPGAVSIQGAAYETVPQRLPFEYENLGEQEVKGFDEPVRAYSVKLKTGEDIPAYEAAPLSGMDAYRKRGSRSTAITLGLLIVIAIALAWWQPWQSAEHPASEQVSSQPDPQPSIAVLPFQTLSEDPQQDYFSDGVTNDIITDLSKFSNLLVIASTSVFVYKDKPINIKQIGQELGVRYILEGSIQKADDRVRINTQLIDATTDHHVWAD